MYRKLQIALKLEMWKLPTLIFKRNSEKNSKCHLYDDMKSGVFWYTCYTSKYYITICYCVLVVYTFVSILCYYTPVLYFEKS